jgi:hypothetical protein
MAAAQCAYAIAMPCPAASAAAMVASISGRASAWLPRSDASSIAVKGTAGVPVTSQIASASTIRAVAAVKSPLHATAVPGGAEHDRQLVERAGFAG